MENYQVCIAYIVYQVCIAYIVYNLFSLLECGTLAGVIVVVSQCCSTWFDPNSPFFGGPKLLFFIITITARTALSYPRAAAEGRSANAEVIHTQC